jgi:hypothetical protein
VKPTAVPENRPFRVVIFGSRTFGDYALLRAKLDLLLSQKLPHVEVVHGCATGADTAARLYALERGLSHKLFEARWADLKAPGAMVRKRADGTPYNAKAGPDRNAEMAEYADAGVAFWDGKSHGTADMIEQMKGRGKPVKVIHVGS